MRKEEDKDDLRPGWVVFLEIVTSRELKRRAWSWLANVDPYSGPPKENAEEEKSTLY